MSSLIKPHTNEASVPRCFCWTRFGAEAGESAESILVRKENERAADDGVFLWGIGNAIGPSVEELLKRTVHPVVLFSPMKSAPKLSDIVPSAIVRWNSGIDLSGRRFDLPKHSVVTSKYEASGKRRHYALVCFNNSPLPGVAGGLTLSLSELRNLKSGRIVGASQVTAVVARTGCVEQAGIDYVVAMQATLVEPYFVRLTEPVPETRLV